jgi:hypothetical protein
MDYHLRSRILLKKGREYDSVLKGKRGLEAI